LAAVKDMKKPHILSEIRRTAEANGGIPPGRARFTQETGIKDSDWPGKIWARWGDVIRDVGLKPNDYVTAYDDDVLIEKFIELGRELGHFPLLVEVRMKTRRDHGFPAHSTFARLGTKRQFAAKILNYCKDRVGYEDMAALCAPVVAEPGKLPPPGCIDPPTDTKAGYVYLAVLKLRREHRYKIGKAVLVERRTDQISIQLPETRELVHTITTDDAYGIEAYWHERFAAKNTNGEWFSLSRQDLDAFKRRKSMWFSTLQLLAGTLLHVVPAVQTIWPH
jgi:Meiotically up-regulated gene 113